MEGVFRPEASNPIPPTTVVDVSCNRELARSSSDASSPTAGNREYILRCSPNMAPVDENKAWTNEKHKLYLNHLELSFVTQLHQSKSLLQKRVPNVKNASEKIKVLRNGCCKASLRAKLVCNFKRVGKNCHPPSVETAGSMELWSTTKHGKSTKSSGLATCSEDLLNFKREEGTGQNFLDEVIQSTSKFESGSGKKVEARFSG
ncbi:hypothetical protein CASFOL_042286 [Castilleja foliolosa]|uniref:Uncharacterized protein n=1 Tax=Castilleja foliolosa TaxID=1961234 RepID=A0ABD3BAC2_9LAMI